MRKQLRMHEPRVGKQERSQSRFCGWIIGVSQNFRLDHFYPLANRFTRDVFHIHFEVVQKMTFMILMQTVILHH